MALFSHVWSTTFEIAAWPQFPIGLVASWSGGIALSPSLNQWKDELKRSCEGKAAPNASVWPNSTWPKPSGRRRPVRRNPLGTSWLPRTGRLGRWDGGSLHSGRWCARRGRLFGRLVLGLGSMEQDARKMYSIPGQRVWSTSVLERLYHELGSLCFEPVG